jgi:hypothetical protein
MNMAIKVPLGHMSSVTRGRCRRLIIKVATAMTTALLPIAFSFLRELRLFMRARIR